MNSKINLPALTALLDERMRALKGGAGRILHGRGGNYPGLEQLLIDVYPPVVLITTFGGFPPELLDLLAKKLILLAETKGFGKENVSIVHQHRVGTRNQWQTLAGQSQTTSITQYLGLNFEIQMGSKQNLGLFLDMEEGHRLVQRIASGKSILNLFAYTCAFSVIAIQAGAARVVNVDLSKTSLSQGRKNHRINGLDLNRAKFQSHDVMKSMSAFRRMGPFDLIICDPPTYQPPSFKAERDYPKLARRIPELLKPNGEVIACLNAPHISPEQVAEWFSNPCYRHIQTLGRPASFDECDANRDLKINHFRVMA